MAPQWVINELAKHLINEMRNYRKETYGNRKLNAVEARELHCFFMDWSHQYVCDQELLLAAREKISRAYNGELNAFLED